MMLKAAVVMRVRELLAEGRNHSEVGRMVRLSRNTVTKIAAGRYPDYTAIRRAKQQAQGSGRQRPMGKCPGCGYRVHLPCRICRARAMAALSTLFAQCGLPFDLLDEPLGLELQPEHQARYEEIRKGRRETRRSAG